MKQLPETLSIDEAVAFMINLPFVPTQCSIEKLLDALSAEEHNKYVDSSSKIEKTLHITLSEMQDHRITLAEVIKKILIIEIGLVRDGYESMLQLDEPNSISARIITPSLLEWGESIGLEIAGWKFHPRWRRKGDRRFSTPYLEIIDEVIREFYEEGGKYYDPNKPPKNEEIEYFIGEREPNLSPSVLGSICTILKPKLTYAKVNTKKKEKKKTPSESASENLMNIWKKIN